MKPALFNRLLLSAASVGSAASFSTRMPSSPLARPVSVYRPVQCQSGFHLLAQIPWTQGVGALFFQSPLDLDSSCSAAVTRMKEGPEPRTWRQSPDLLPPLSGLFPLQFSLPRHSFSFVPSLAVSLPDWGVVPVDLLMPAFPTRFPSPSPVATVFLFSPPSILKASALPAVQRAPLVLSTIPRPFAMGVPADLAHSFVRFSLGRDSSLEEVQSVESLLPSLIARLRHC